MTVAPQLTVLSLGWGVQSWTLAAMVALGELPPIDYAIHADTTWEREETYRFAEQWTPWLEARGVKVLTVRGKRSHTMVHQSQKSGARYVTTPLFTVNLDTGDRGQIKRQCTGDWKIEPQNKLVNGILKERGISKFETLQEMQESGKVKKKRVRRPDIVHKWLGISMDEWQRARALRDEAGYSVKEISAILGVGANILRTAFDAYDRDEPVVTRTKQKPITPDEQAAILPLAQKGMPPSTIAAQTRTNVRRVKLVIAQAGL